jgi:site-specific recombinase
MREDSFAETGISGLQGTVDMPDVDEMLAAVSRQREKGKVIESESESGHDEDVPAEALSVVSDVKELEEKIGSLETIVGQSREEISRLEKKITSMGVDLSTISTVVSRLSRVLDRATRVEPAIQAAETAGESTVSEPEGDLTSDQTLSNLRSLRDQVQLGQMAEVSAATANKHAGTSTPAVFRRREI